jgi:hypothetical protein
MPIIICLLILFSFNNALIAKEVKKVIQEQTKQEKENELNYWISASGVRHNSSCRWYGITKNGKYCKKTEGRVCKICGG